MATSDKDLYQLISDRVFMVSPAKVGNRMGPAEVAEKIGVGPRKVVEWLALTGDTVDNIPGVPGVGPENGGPAAGPVRLVAGPLCGPEGRRFRADAAVAGTAQGHCFSERGPRGIEPEIADGSALGRNAREKAGSGPAEAVFRKDGIQVHGGGPEGPGNPRSPRSPKDPETREPRVGFWGFILTEDADASGADEYPNRIGDGKVLAALRTR